MLYKQYPANIPWSYDAHFTQYHNNISTLLPCSTGQSGHFCIVWVESPRVYPHCTMLILSPLHVPCIESCPLCLCVDRADRRGEAVNVLITTMWDAMLGDIYFISSPTWVDTEWSVEQGKCCFLCCDGLGSGLSFHNPGTILIICLEFECRYYKSVLIRLESALISMNLF